jgi:hypothetical protein
MKKANQTKQAAKDELRHSFKLVSSEHGVRHSLMMERGFLRSCEIMISEDPCQFFLDPNGSIDRLRGELRSKLESLKLPTDLSSLEPTDWEIAFSRIYPNAQTWLRRIHKLTETLSEGDLAGSLLFRLNNLVGEGALTGHLLTIWTIMDLYANYKIAEINSLAIAGVAANQARIAGPKARRTKRQQIRNIVWQHTKQYWRDHPTYKEDASNTAKCIAVSVCKDLKAKKLLPGRGRAEKTIADDILAGIHGGVL